MKKIQKLTALLRADDEKTTQSWNTLKVGNQSGNRTPQKNPEKTLNALLW